MLEPGPLSHWHLLPPSLLASLVVLVTLAGLYHAYTGRPIRGRAHGALEALVAMNAIVFVLEGVPLHRLLALVPPWYDPVVHYAGFVPARFVVGEAWWSPLTHMFVHADLPHLFFNMLVLFLVAPKVEDRIGRRPFVLLYVATGLAATLATLTSLYAVPAGARDGLLLRLPSWNVPSIGASGAVFGILGFAIGAFPRDKVPVPTPFLLVPLGPAVAAILLVLIEAFRAMSGTPVAWWAHLAGLLVGIPWGIAWRLRHPEAAAATEPGDPDEDAAVPDGPG